MRLAYVYEETCQIGGAGLVGNVELWTGNVEGGLRSVEEMVCGVEVRVRAVEVLILSVEGVRRGLKQTSSK